MRPSHFKSLLALLFTSVSLVSSAVAAQTLYLVPQYRYSSAASKESSSTFIAPANTVLTGRWHGGDENGQTVYQYATLQAVNEYNQPVPGTIAVQTLEWSNWIKESSGIWFDAPQGTVLIGRQHSGDENGNTRYLTGRVTLNGLPTEVIDVTTSGGIKESGSIWFTTDSRRVMTGRMHQGDENKNSYYRSGTLRVALPPAPDAFRIIVKLHPQETFFPMAPLDFIRASRFRHHKGWGTDQGYNKSSGSWITGNDKSWDYFDIPVSFINSYTINPDGTNRRPRDSNSGSDWNVFLQPEGHPQGNASPTGQVPSFRYRTQDGRQQYWLFYGYNESTHLISFSHQGDWEDIIVHTDNGLITGASLSAHGERTFHPVSSLQTYVDGNIQVLVVYVAKGTHALYPTVGNFHTGGTDETRDGGVEWVITHDVQELQDQPWKDYAGAWGEVGEFATTTGPLGPWYKKIQ
ncbi:hypothetical protein [Cystobacter fuscus]|uniref:hypothetical protein n=1 Tax=Cystobacter fuscus TaxID=43 RepID=UPI0037BEFE94